ncbi:hypothetical protein IWW38_001923 [Coemansia aciculifera]|uniref:Uncharacterized protein n=1 Tax=Coemansia aciculifera TaxID=417176 RepID=A0ACC1M5I1_9FUNG|nr:hypothetical protein IWW38_001923 [Coemansia aciculifera]
MQSRTHSTQRDKGKGEKGGLEHKNHFRICYSRKFQAAVSNASSEEGEVASKAHPALKKIQCFELLGPRVAQWQLEERRRRSSDQRGGWADVWYARWLMRLQVTTVLGQDPAKQAWELLTKSGLQTQQVVQTVVGDDKERAAMFHVATMDELMVRWPGNVKGFYLRMLTPNLNMGKRYVESWKSGSQRIMLGKFWDDAVSLSGVKLAARAFANMANAWDNEKKE